MKPEYLPGVRSNFDEWVEFNRMSGSYNPVRAIMMAQIEAAVHERDIKWFTAQTSDHIFSFENCCSALGIDPQAARPRLIAQAQTEASSVVRKYNRRPVQCGDIPGRTYTHEYAKCPDGILCSKCPECRSRYHYWYLRTLKQTCATKGETNGEATTA